MPANIKDAIAQRQGLHSDVENFYESILWRKEKLICLSRMGRENNNNIYQRVSSLIHMNYLNYLNDFLSNIFRVYVIEQSKIQYIILLISRLVIILELYFDWYCFCSLGHCCQNHLPVLSVILVIVRLSVQNQSL